MSFEIRVFQIAKSGNKPEECEDALSFDPQGRLFAIADGATDSAFQRLWAGLLVNGFVNHPPDFSRPSRVKQWFFEWIKAQQEQWSNNIQWENLSWSGHNKAKTTGGLATFLGIYFFPDKPVWKGIAFGDCNFFHFLDNGQIIYDYKPITTLDEFGSNPVALSSINLKPELMLSHMIEIGGDYRKDDVIVLATDALAAWLLKLIESCSLSLWHKLLELKTSEEFEAFINELRNANQIKNDDTTLVIIKITDAPKKANSKAGF